MGRKKTRTHVKVNMDEDTTPRSFVINRGHLTHACNQLMLDMRMMVGPFTALNLQVCRGWARRAACFLLPGGPGFSRLPTPTQVRRRNVLKDFVHVAGPLGITHIMVLTQSERGTNLVRAAVGGWLPRQPIIFC